MIIFFDIYLIIHFHFIIIEKKSRYAIKNFKSMASDYMVKEGLLYKVCFKSISNITSLRCSLKRQLSSCLFKRENTLHSIILQYCHFASHIFPDCFVDFCNQSPV